MKAVSRIDNPTERDFKKMVRENFIPDCLVTPKDVTNARLVFGPNLSGVEGKPVRYNPEKVDTDDYV